jgi:hypothetical protein
MSSHGNSQILKLQADSRRENERLLCAAKDVLSQGTTLLSSLSSDTYSQIAPSPYNASLGQHYRHMLEHFQCLLRGQLAREINYDARGRNLALETDLPQAMTATQEILNALASQNPDALERNCLLINSLGYTDQTASLVNSTIAREYAYCIGHAIHHFAIIRFLCHHFGVRVQSEFGIAPSTLKSLQQVAGR